MSPAKYKSYFKGVEYELTFTEWSILTGIPADTLRGRHKKWKTGRFPKENILFVGVLACNKRPPRPLMPEADMSWIYQSMRPETERLKRNHKILEAL